MKIISKRYLVVYLLALLLQLLPLPGFLNVLKPELLMCVLLSQVIFYKNYINFLVILLLSLLVDVIQTSVLGLHLFAISLVLWLAHLNTRAFKLYPAFQQLMMFFLYMSLYEFINIFINHMFGVDSNIITALLTTLSSAMLWPWINIIYENISNYNFKKQSLIINNME
jgi:rod shape-determining protein MreD